ncbi:hypothetical protein V8E36_009961 [Tilletia maclaganii]
MWTGMSTSLFCKLRRSWRSRAPCSRILHPKGDAKKHTPEGWNHGWLGAFKKRFGIKAYRRHGEAVSVEEEVLEPRVGM